MLDDKEKDTTVPQNVRNYLPVSIEQHPRRLYSSICHLFEFTLGLFNDTVASGSTNNK